MFKVKRMKELRVNAGASQELLAFNMQRLGHGWDRQTVADIERNKRRVRLDEACDLAGLFDVPIGELVDASPHTEWTRPETDKERMARAHAAMRTIGTPFKDSLAKIAAKLEVVR